MEDIGGKMMGPAWPLRRGYREPAARGEVGVVRVRLVVVDVMMVKMLMMLGMMMVGNRWW